VEHNTFDDQSIDELTSVARKAIAELAQRPDTVAFQSLLEISQLVGECLGTSAQTLSTHMSWAQIGDVAGTSRQNAWARWSQ